MTTNTTTTNHSILEALRAAPGATAAELAEAAGVGRSTASKALQGLERDGLACRMAGGRDGGRRLPDRFEAVTSAPSEAPAPAAASAAPAEEPATRLNAGELRGLVLDDLGSRSEPASPSAIAKSLGRSGGAVSNALERLVSEGAVQRVNDKPRRYAVAATT